MDLSDAEAIEASFADPSSFGLIFERHCDAVHRFAVRRVGRDAAGDIVAETFVRSFAIRARFDLTRDTALPWLYGICTNLLRRHRRTEARAYKALAKTGVDPLRTADTTDRSLDRVEAQGMSRRLADALASLKANQRDVLLLFAVAQLTYPEIAAALRIPEGTVRSRLSRARTHLRERLGPTP